ncbi:MAG: alanine racemase [Kiloniellaceae bacterium]
MSVGEPGADPAAARAGAILTVDLAAVRANYRRLCAELGGVECAAVVKANAYGLGLARVAPALARAGASTFFTAQLGEAIEARVALGAACPKALIFVLNGAAAGPAADFIAHDAWPVLNSLGEVDAWAAAGRAAGRPLPAALHVDTGMSRLGLPDDELEALAVDPARLEGIDPRLVMSHLACAEARANPLNEAQRRGFVAARARLPAAPASLANSSGIFLGAAYGFDLARPGAALYGVNPTPDAPSPVCQVIRLQGRILQVRAIDAPRTVGYGATHRAPGPIRVATVAVGYADGYLRSLSGRGHAWVGARRVSVIGRISMDLITLDVTDVPEPDTRPGGLVDLIGPREDVDTVAAAAGTIGYEILTSLGARYHRVYTGTGE